jgi:hypothetical protein
MLIVVSGGFIKQAFGETFPFSIVYTLRDSNLDGRVDEVDSTPPVIGMPSFWGFISNLDTSRDETFVEFKIQPGGVATSAKLNLTMSNSVPSLGTVAVRSATYQGTGAVNESLFGSAGTFLTTFQVTPPPPGQFCCTFTLDITGLYNQLRSAGASHIGLRLYDPSWAGSPSRGQAFLTNASLDLELNQVPEITAQVDVRPGNPGNPVNPRSHGVLQVAVLTDADLDATKVIVGLLRFGILGVEAAPVQAVLADVDNDGDTDLVAHFRTHQTRIQCDSATMVLTGETLSGQRFRGTEEIRTVGCESQ